MNNIFDVLNNICETFLTKLDETKKNYIGDDVKFKSDITFKYDDKPLDVFDRRNIIIDKLNKWTKLSHFFGHNVVIKFIFSDDLIFYFTWDDDLGAFTTEDPNGDRFMYDVENEDLKKITTDSDDISDNDVECTVDTTHNDISYCTEGTKHNDISDGEGIEKDFNLADDSNLAFNLKNSLRESFKIWNNDNNETKINECDEIFCPFKASENFKKDVIDTAAYITDFDDNGEPVKITFNISWLIPEYDFGTDSYYRAIDDIYHNESENLDKFCELIKDVYNFSMGSWDVVYDADDIDEINFSFVF